MEAVFQTPWGEGKCRTRLLGRFNAQNLAACIALLCANGYPIDKVLEVLAKIRPASGRMDCIMNSGKPLVVVDYAHTPDALEKALHFAGNQTAGRGFVVRIRLRRQPRLRQTPIDGCGSSSGCR